MVIFIDFYSDKYNGFTKKSFYDFGIFLSSKFHFFLYSLLRKTRQSKNQSFWLSIHLK